MTKLEFDPLDAALTVVTMMTSFIIVGIGSFDLFNVDFAAEVTAIAGYSLSTAWVLAAGAFVVTVVTNDNTSFSTFREDVENLDQYYAGAVIGTLGLLVAWPVFPQLTDFVMSEDLWGVAYVFVVSTGQFVVGWML